MCWEAKDAHGSSGGILLICDKSKWSKVRECCGDILVSVILEEVGTREWWNLGSFFSLWSKWSARCSNFCAVNWMQLLVGKSHGVLEVIVSPGFLLNRGVEKNSFMNARFSSLDLEK